VISIQTLISSDPTWIECNVLILRQFQETFSSMYKLNILVFVFENLIIQLGPGFYTNGICIFRASETIKKLSELKKKL